MSLRYLDTRGESPEEGCVMFCATSGWAFGPVFADIEVAQAFCRWLGCDARSLTEAELKDSYREFTAVYGLGMDDLLPGEWARKHRAECGVSR